MLTTDNAYDTKFEKIVMGMGLNVGMFAYNAKGYISPVTRELYQAYIDKKLNAMLVNDLLNSLK